jgi:hypothetical protein
LLFLLGTAAVNGQREEDLHALLDQTYDTSISGIFAEPIHSPNTAFLRLAAAHGGNFFLKMVFEFGCKSYLETRHLFGNCRKQ